MSFGLEAGASPNFPACFGIASNLGTGTADSATSAAFAVYEWEPAADLVNVVQNVLAKLCIFFENNLRTGLSSEVFALLSAHNCLAL
jgi:hypothetical protein